MWPFTAKKQEDIKPPATTAYELLMEQATHCLKQAKAIREVSVESIRSSCPNVASQEMDLATKHENRACELFQEAIKFWSAEITKVQNPKE